MYQPSFSRDFALSMLCFNSLYLHEKYIVLKILVGDRIGYKDSIQSRYLYCILEVLHFFLIPNPKEYEFAENDQATSH